jgi:hypothetical protein
MVYKQKEEENKDNNNMEIRFSNLKFQKLIFDFDFDLKMLAHIFPHALPNSSSYAEGTA